MLKFLVVDAHSAIREGTGAFLRQTFAPARVMGAAYADEACHLAATHADFDAVVVDFDLPGSAGPHLVGELRRRGSRAPIVVLSWSETKSDVRRALALGAAGYVSKAMRGPTVAAAIRLVLDGEIYVPPFVLRESEDATSRDRDGTLARLTGRQSEILVRLARGETNGMIAGALSLAEKTVKVHVTAIFRTLDVADRRQAARLAQEAGLL